MTIKLRFAQGGGVGGGGVHSVMILIPGAGVDYVLLGETVQ